MVTLVTADMAHMAVVVVILIQPKQVRAVVVAEERVDPPTLQVAAEAAVLVSLVKVLMDMRGIIVLLLAAAEALVGQMAVMVVHIPAVLAARMAAVGRLLGDVAAALRAPAVLYVSSGPVTLDLSLQRTLDLNF